MSLVQIKLPKGVWIYDPAKQLGKRGGFGSVFLGTSGSGEAVAVKKLHIEASDAAHRELRMAAELGDRNLRHVMPVLDSGQDSESEGYYVIMPVAQSSLQDLLDDRGAIPEKGAISILTQIVEGLLELPDIVHRDLKPANILLAKGTWRIADFGIARFVEESTSAQTLKSFLSPQYAAPEQWRYQPASHATDVYAVGCIAYALLTGVPPFFGSEDIQQNHLHATPPRLPDASPQMNAIVTMALRKEPAARPSLDRIKEVLGSHERMLPRTGAMGKLAAAAAAHEELLAKVAAGKEQERATREARQALAGEARQTLNRIGEILSQRIREHVPTALESWMRGLLTIHVGSGKLEFDISASNSGVFDADDFPRSEWDVICGALIGVEQPEPLHKRSANLWYTRQRNQSGEYRWYEVAYEGNSFTGRGFPFEPTAVTAEVADRAHWTGMDVVRVSYGPYAIDDEDVETFIERWTHLLAEASTGNLLKVARALPPKGPY